MLYDDRTDARKVSREPLAALVGGFGTPVVQPAELRDVAPAAPGDSTIVITSVISAVMMVIAGNPWRRGGSTWMLVASWRMMTLLRFVDSSARTNSA